MSLTNPGMDYAEILKRIEVFQNTMEKAVEAIEMLAYDEEESYVYVVCYKMDDGTPKAWSVHSSMEGALKEASEIKEMRENGEFDKEVFINRTVLVT